MRKMPKISGISVESRFWLKVYQRGDCWEWRGAKDDLGYGAFGAYGLTWAAHRFAYELVKGPIPGRLTMDHLCRHPWCVNPNHLEAVPHRINMLRGDTLGARNARLTHCKHGHEFSPENTLRRGDSPHRICRTCLARRKSAWWRGFKVRRPTDNPERHHRRPTTHCLHGHELTPENSYWPKAGKHYRPGCRICRDERVARFQAKRRTR